MVKLSHNSLLLVLGKAVSFLCVGVLFGCTSISRVERHPQTKAEVTENQSDETLKPYIDFDNNTSNVRASFGIKAADCIGNTGDHALGAYVIKLNNNSVAKQRGLAIGDRILAIGTHTITSTKQLSYVIQRITPDTFTSIVFERGGKKKGYQCYPSALDSIR